MYRKNTRVPLLSRSKTVGAPSPRAPTSLSSARPSPSAKTPAPSSSEVQKKRFSVLYYKRSNKVHKSRGVTRSDGILSIASPPSCFVTLVDADESAQQNPEECDDEDNEESQKKKKKAKKGHSLPKQGGPGTLYSGTNPSVAKRAFGMTDQTLEEDDTLVFPQWECQIVSVLLDSNSQDKMVKGALGGGLHSAIGSPFLKKAPPAAFKSPLASGTGMEKRPAPLLTSRKRPRDLLSSSISPLRNVPLVQRKPPPQPNKNRIAQCNQLEKENKDNDGGSKDDSGKILPAGTMIKHRALPFLAGVKRRVVPISRTAQAHALKSPVKSIAQVDLPPSVKSTLRPHQEEAIIFLWNCLTGQSKEFLEIACKGIVRLSNSARGAILADEMGLGKTLVTIATIVALHRHNPDRRFVVVCPSSLVKNWSKEFDKWVGRACQPKRVVIDKGGASASKLIRGFVPTKPKQSEVLIISYDQFRLNSSTLSECKQIELLVVDEGHRLKNASGTQTLSALHSLSAQSRLLITGTPIQNELCEFYALVHFVCPGILGDIAAFRQTYERPMALANKTHATTEQKQRGVELSKALDRITRTLMIRRLQRDVLKQILPPRIEVLLFCRPSSRQRDLYKSLTAKALSDCQKSAWTGPSSDILVVLTKIRKLCTHPLLLDNKNGIMRMPLPPSKSSDEDTDDDVNDSETKSDSSLLLSSGKLTILGSLLQYIRSNNPTDKVVVISNYTSALDAIERLILRPKGKKCPFARLDGSVEQGARQSLVDTFNRQPANLSFVFLLSSKAGGCGLNLVGANRLVMVDPDWNPATDAQAMARVYRQGQKKPCFIYRLFTTGTVEEVILQRQMKKNDLASLTMDQGRQSSKSSQSSFTREELHDCFELKTHSQGCDTQRRLRKEWSDYVGVDSLKNEGCSDEPLLTVAEQHNNCLSYVRIIKDDDDKGKETPSQSIEDDHSEDESADEESGMPNEEALCFSSEEEFVD